MAWLRPEFVLGTVWSHKVSNGSPEQGLGGTKVWSELLNIPPCLVFYHSPLDPGRYIYTWTQEAGWKGWEARHSLVYVAQRSEISQQAFSDVTFYRSQLICLIVRPIYLSNTNTNISLAPTSWPVWLRRSKWVVSEVGPLNSFLERKSIFLLTVFVLTPLCSLLHALQPWWPGHGRLVPFRAHTSVNHLKAPALPPQLCGYIRW